MVAGHPLEQDRRLHREIGVLLVVAESGGGSGERGLGQRPVGDLAHGVQVHGECLRRRSEKVLVAEIGDVAVHSRTGERLPRQAVEGGSVPVGGPSQQLLDALRVLVPGAPSSRDLLDQHVIVRALQGPLATSWNRRVRRPCPRLSHDASLAPQGPGQG